MSKADVNDCHGDDYSDNLHDDPSPDDLLSEAFEEEPCDNWGGDMPYDTNPLYINAEKSGKVTKVGRSDTKEKEYDSIHKRFTQNMSELECIFPMQIMEIEDENEKDMKNKPPRHLTFQSTYDYNIDYYIRLSNEVTVPLIIHVWYRHNNVRSLLMTTIHDILSYCDVTSKSPLAQSVYMEISISTNTSDHMIVEAKAKVQPPQITTGIGISKLILVPIYFDIVHRQNGVRTGAMMLQTVNALGWCDQSSPRSATFQHVFINVDIRKEILSRSGIVIRRADLCHMELSESTKLSSVSSVEVEDNDGKSGYT